MKKLLRLSIILTIVIVALVATGSMAMAKPDGPVDGSGGTAFLCPAVGGPDAGGPLPGGQDTFLPGNNQAGANANYHAWNTLGPGDSPGPGNVIDGKGNKDWSPIWPPTGD